MTISIFHEQDGDISVLRDKTISIIGFGNQAKAQALNMRESGLNIIVGTSNDDYINRAKMDNFKTYSIQEAVQKGDFIFVLISDKIIEETFRNEIVPNLSPQKTLIFPTGYHFVFDIINIPKEADILIISPKGLGEMIRKQYLNKEGFFSFISIYQDKSGGARRNLLALTKAIGGLSRAGIELSAENQTYLKLFAEQAFLPAFNLVMMSAIRNLTDANYSPEAIFIELILSEEMIFTVDKMIEVGLVRQMNFHSQTSQYGSLSRGIKFSKVGDDLNRIQEGILEKIENGEFSEEWKKANKSAKLDIMKHFAYNSEFWELEKKVYENLNFPIEKTQTIKLPTKEQIQNSNELSKIFNQYKSFFGR
jgi:ketol-acid reductoisomerase